MKTKHTEDKEYEDIPGTFVFDAERSRQGYHINICLLYTSDAADE